LASDGRLRVRLAADYGRLEFLRVLRSHPAEQLSDTGLLIPPPTADFIGPPMPPIADLQAAGADSDAAEAADD
ncbi:rod shape-determining protein MreC, partial [Paracoccus sp. PXZ]